MNKFAQPFALLTTGLLAGVYYYGLFTVIPAFYEVPLKVHLEYRVALMNHNAFYVQGLTAAAILAPIWLALAAKHLAIPEFHIMTGWLFSRHSAFGWKDKYPQIFSPYVPGIKRKIFAPRFSVICGE